MLRTVAARIVIGQGYARRSHAYDGKGRISGGGNKPGFKRGDFGAPERLYLSEWQRLNVPVTVAVIFLLFGTSSHSQAFLLRILYFLYPSADSQTPLDS